MGRNTSKKRQYYERDRRRPQDFGLSDTLQSVKRRRLSDEGSEADRTRERGGVSSSRAEDNDGWQIVPIKSKSRQQRQHQSNSPGLSFQHKVTKPVRIEQLRDLALYILADGTAPDWVAVSNARHVAKIVVTMVPGLDSTALERAKELLKKLRNLRRDKVSRENEEGKACTESVQNMANKDGDRSQNGSILDNGVGDPETEELDDIKDFSDLLQADIEDWLFSNTIPVLAPGDTKYSRVHSPLQAVLMTPETTSRAAMKQKPEKHLKAVATPIVDFVHTSDELREAEYPIHPAIFDSDADAALESIRRERTGQSKAAGWVDSNVTKPRPLVTVASHASHHNAISQGLTIYAIDCEMVLTTDQQSSLARISVVSWPDGKVVLDKYVKPDLPIENYFTQYSGITPEVLEHVSTKLSDIQDELMKLCTPSTILLGHSLESDLNALKLTHPFIVDTSMLYPHPRGLPLRSSLKFLANKYLKRDIQTGGADGHNSVEDARAVLDLVKLKCEKGPKYGTPEANGESIFKRLSRHKRSGENPLTSAIVEYGSAPERGLGKDATYAIGCQNDDEITAGLTRAIKGDSEGQEIPAGGADFIWARLRGLEFARGWVTSLNSNSNPVSTESVASEDNENTTDTLPNLKDAQTSQREVDKTILATLRHIVQIRSLLPPTTLFMLLSGTSDVRPALKLQAMQAQYRREFKVKKWDELSVRWTDNEEQALRNAVERARMGWGWLDVV